MVKPYSKARKALESIYEDSCAVFIQEKIQDPDTKETKFSETSVHIGQPCRLSFTMVKSASDGHVANVSQAVTLFIAPDVVVPSGSKIVVTQQSGIVTLFSNSGESSKYMTHQEIPLELFKRYA